MNAIILTLEIILHLVVVHLSPITIPAAFASDAARLLRLRREKRVWRRAILKMWEKPAGPEGIWK